MTLVESVTIVLTKYADFTGRARRSEYWWFALASFVVSFLLSFSDLLQALWSLAVLIPTIAVGVRRMHDTGRSGWFLLVGLIPIIGWILVIVWLATEGDPSSNEYGPSPK